MASFSNTSFSVAAFSELAFDLGVQIDTDVFAPQQNHTFFGPRDQRITSAGRRDQRTTSAGVRPIRINKSPNRK